MSRASAWRATGGSRPRIAAMKQLRAVAFLVAPAILLWSLMMGEATGQSVFSLQGPGLANPPANGRGRGLGGMGFALADSLRGAPANPALGCLTHQVTIGMTLVPGRTWARDATHERPWSDTALSHLQLLIPIRRGCVLVTGLRPERSIQAEARWSEEYAGAPLERRFRREGDDFALPLAVACGERRGWSAALGADFLFASLLETVAWDFSGSDYPDTGVETTEDLSGVAPVVALSFAPAPRGRLGLLYRHRVDLEGDRKVTGPSGVVSEGAVAVRYPRRIGAGGTIEWHHLLLVGDIIWDGWGDYERQGPDGTGAAGTLKDAWAWAIGVEHVGREEGPVSRWRRPLRLGFRQDVLPQTSPANGARIWESVVAVGTGWVFGGERALLDLTIEIGQRGNLDDNAARERFLRFAVSAAGREPWKRPERRGRW